MTMNPEERRALIEGMQRIRRAKLDPIRAILGVDREVCEAWQEGLLAAINVAADCRELFDHADNHATFVKRICATENPYKKDATDA